MQNDTTKSELRRMLASYSVVQNLDDGSTTLLMVDSNISLVAVNGYLRFMVVRLKREETRRNRCNSGANSGPANAFRCRSTLSVGIL